MRYFLTFIIIILVFYACKKTSEPQKQTKIIYLDSVYHGKNILSFPDSVLLQSKKSYSLGAELEKDAQLKIVLYNIEQNNSSIWTYNQPIGFFVSNFNYLEGKQEFVFTQTGKIDVHIILHTDTEGMARIDFYENGEALTKSKIIRWQ